MKKLVVILAMMMLLTGCGDEAPKQEPDTTFKPIQVEEIRTEEIRVENIYTENIYTETIIPEYIEHEYIEEEVIIPG